MSAQPPNIGTVLDMLRSLPSNKAREMALGRLLQKGLRAEVAAIATEVGMRKQPDVWTLGHVIQLARLVVTGRTAKRRAVTPGLEIV